MYFADRVKDTTSTVGTGDFLLDGSNLSTYRRPSDTFSGMILRVGYCRVSTGGYWEVGKGTFNGVDTITRDLVLDGLFGPGVLVNFTNTVDDIFITVPADQVRYIGLGPQYASARGMLMP